MPDDFIPYGRQDIDDDDIAAVTHVLRSARLTQGPWVERFEQALADYLGADYVCACANGTAALQLAYAAIDLGPEDEIITSPITFAATASAARWLGARVYFADVDSNSGLLDPDSVAALITPRTKAIVPVHLAGMPADMTRLRALCDANNIYLIEDAAHALGARWQEQTIGSGLADIATFSFHPVKHITTGEGGAVSTQNETLHRKMTRLRQHGVVRDPDQLRYKSPGPWYYEVQELGYNFRLSDIQAALGVSQLKKQQGWHQRRSDIASLYREIFDDIAPDLVRYQTTPAGAESAHHLFVSLIDFESAQTTRAEVMNYLSSHGIGTQVHYIPLTSQPYFQDSMPAHANVTLLGAHRYYRRALSLPMFPALRDRDVEYVANSLVSALLKRAKRETV